MARADFERRQPRVGIDQLRRDLRHADQELFTVLTAARSDKAKRGRTSQGPILLALFATVPLAFGAWAASTRSAVARPDTVRVEVTRVDAATINTPPDAPTVDPPRVATASQPPRSAHANSARRLHAASARSVRPAVLAATAPAAWHPTRHVPRPLSPGEFGRR